MRVRDGEYGGPLTLFNTELDQVVVMSPLNNFMVNSMFHNITESSLQFGLMGSVETIPENETLRTILYHGTSLWESFSGWGETLQMMGIGEVKPKSDDVVTNYLGYWTDNGAFYYYNTLPHLNYEDTILEITSNLSASLPINYINYDSWWYVKGEDLGVKSWTAKEEIFPSGLHSLYERTGLGVVAHNRYWSTDNVYSRDNGGMFNFVTEDDNKRSLPQEQIVDCRITPSAHTAISNV